MIGFRLGVRSSRRSREHCEAPSAVHRRLPVLPRQDAGHLSYVESTLLSCAGLTTLEFGISHANQAQYVYCRTTLGRLQQMAREALHDQLDLLARLAMDILRYV